MKHRNFARLALLATLALPALAFAHPGHGPESGFALGFGHPFGAADHLCALLAVGLLAARLGGRAAVLFTGVVLSLLALGLGAGAIGMQLPRVAVLTSVAIVIGLVLVLAPPRRLVGAIIALAATLAFFSGMVHGEWLLAGASGWGFAAGFIVSSALLIGAGFGAIRVVRRVVAARAATRR